MADERLEGSGEHAHSLCPQKVSGVEALLDTDDRRSKNQCDDTAPRGACSENWGGEGSDIAAGRGDGGGACPDHRAVASHKPG